jgi:hypothetical protein
MTTNQELSSAQESRVRRKARRLGYRLRKSRRAISSDNHGRFMVISTRSGRIVSGERFDLSLDAIEAWLSD